LFGGLTGIMMASAPIDFHLHDSYFIVAHFHYTVFGTVVFAAFAGSYFWFPKMTGRMLDEGLGKWHFWLMFIGFHTTFTVQHWLGTQAIARRYANYVDTAGFTVLNQISTVSSFVLVPVMLPFIWSVIKSWRYGEIVTVDDPWAAGNSLEWAASCPPPRHNFTTLPRIRGNVVKLRSEEHTSELQSRFDLVCRLLLEKKKIHQQTQRMHNAR